VRVAPLGGMPSLVAVGLSVDADLAYRTLLDHGPRRLGDLSRQLAVPAPRVRSALDELADIGAARPVASPGRTDRAPVWVAAPADRVAADVLRRRREAAVTAHRLGRRLATPAALGLDPAGPGVRLIASTTAVRAAILAQVRSGPRELLSMNPDLEFSTATVRGSAGAHAGLFRHRTVIRDLGVPPGPADASAELAGELAGNGGQLRRLPSLPTRIMVFDRATALVRVDAVDPARGLLEVTGAGAVALLVQRFFQHWDQAQDAAGPAPEPLGAREQAVLRLLATGLPDAAVAAALGLSPRTVAYTVRGLLDRYGVTNRFQLGLALGGAARDLLTPTEEPAP
jgi:DNA-binding CsgD family transcriptional regulator